MADADAVISTVGVNPSRKPVNAYSAGTQAMLEAIRRHEVRRIVCVSSKELDEEGTHDEPWLYRFVIALLLSAVNRTIYADMRRMEVLLHDSDRDWTIIRPAGLFAADRVTVYRCPAGHEARVSTSTADLADALIRASVNGLGSQQTLQVLTDQATPPYLRLLARQAGLHQR